MKPQDFNVNPQKDADGICASQSLSSGGEQSLSLNGALVSNGSISFTNADHFIDITSSSNNSGITFTIEGKDNRGGKTITEAITGPNSGTVTSTESFRKITSIKASGDTSGSITVGVSGECVSNIVPLCLATPVFNVAIEVEVLESPSPTLTYDIEATMDDVQTCESINSLAWSPHDIINGKSTTESTGYLLPHTAVRLHIKTFAAGIVKFKVIQQG